MDADAFSVKIQFQSLTVFEPAIDSIHPLFGPASGGTNLTATGSGLRSWNSTEMPDVKVGDIPCILLTWYL